MQVIHVVQVGVSLPPVCSAYTRACDAIAGSASMSWFTLIALPTCSMLHSVLLQGLTSCSAVAWGYHLCILKRR